MLGTVACIYNRCLIYVIIIIYDKPRETRNTFED